MNDVARQSLALYLIAKPPNMRAWNLGIGLATVAVLNCQPQQHENLLLTNEKMSDLVLRWALDQQLSAPPAARYQAER